MEFEERRYINYMYIGGNYGIQGLVKVNNEKSALEPINPNIHEEFINRYTLYDVCTIFEDIQKKLHKYWQDARIWKLQDSYLVMTEHYLKELVDKRISHMSICIHNSPYINNPYINNPYIKDVFISRLDCLEREQFDYITQSFKAELSIMTHFRYKLYELPKFKWEGI